MKASSGDMVNRYHSPNLVLIHLMISEEIIFADNNDDDNDG